MNRMPQSVESVKLANESDAMAIERTLGGDRDAFRVLVERHSHSIFRLAYRLTGNQHDAEEVVQEAFLRAFQKLGQFAAIISVAFLCLVARRAFLGRILRFGDLRPIGRGSLLFKFRGSELSLERALQTEHKVPQLPRWEVLYFHARFNAIADR